jgi:signal transduction histidine kinase
VQLHPDDGKGKGLGLARCHKIVEQYGGHLRVRSAEGEGAIFQVLLPRQTIQTTVPVG